MHILDCWRICDLCWLTLKLCFQNGHRQHLAKHSGIVLQYHGGICDLCSKPIHLPVWIWGESLVIWGSWRVDKWINEIMGDAEMIKWPTKNVGINHHPVDSFEEFMCDLKRSHHGRSILRILHEIKIDQGEPIQNNDLDKVWDAFVSGGSP